MAAAAAHTAAVVAVRTGAVVVVNKAVHTETEAAHIGAAAVASAAARSPCQRRAAAWVAWGRCLRVRAATRHAPLNAPDHAEPHPLQAAMLLRCWVRCGLWHR